MELVRNFLSQAQTSELKTKGRFLDSYQGLKVKVSFGMSQSSRIPWISFLASGMTTSNGYYPVILYYKRQSRIVLAYGISETNDFEQPWSKEVFDCNEQIADIIDKPERYGNSFVHSVFEPKYSKDDWKLFEGDKEVSDEIFEEKLISIVETYKSCVDREIADKTSSFGQGLFYMEQQLEDFIIHNWDETEFGQKYDLIFEDGELKSKQFKTPIGRMDILAKDKKTGSHVVIELKRGQSSDDTIGQVMRYMGWVKEELKDNEVKGIIVAGTFDEQLHYAQQMVPDIDVFLYEVDFKLSRHRK